MLIKITAIADIFSKAVTQPSKGILTALSTLACVNCLTFFSNSEYRDRNSWWLRHLTVPIPALNVCKNNCKMTCAIGSKPFSLRSVGYSHGICMRVIAMILIEMYAIN